MIEVLLQFHIHKSTQHPISVFTCNCVSPQGEPQTPYLHSSTHVLSSVPHDTILLHCNVCAGLGGGGVFMTGFNVPVTFGPWLDTYLQQGPWNVVVIMIGRCTYL